VVSLLRLWEYTAQFKSDGALTNMDDIDIADSSFWAGDPTLFVKTLADLKWLDRRDDGIYCIHEWAEHNTYAANANARSKKASNAAKAKYEQCGNNKQAVLKSEVSNAKVGSEQCGNESGAVLECEISSAPSPSPSPSPLPVPKDNYIPSPPIVGEGYRAGDDAIGKAVGEPVEPVVESKKKPPAKNTDPKKRHGEFVMLTDSERGKLVEKLGEQKTIGMIERLDNYIGSTGKKYASHYHTILNWIRMDADKNESRLQTETPRHPTKEHYDDGLPFPVDVE